MVRPPVSMSFGSKDHPFLSDDFLLVMSFFGFFFSYLFIWQWSMTWGFAMMLICVIFGLATFIRGVHVDIHLRKEIEHLQKRKPHTPPRLIVRH
ncbi:MAG: hypothetical protein H6502_00780 [Candidatus Woesearchaeota archaeon]|nr:MAG: hypothetical protein H6502_00780 [Candidatus Woesearchaeota archaeon]